MIATGEHDRMIGNMLRVGKVAQLQASPPRVKVTVGENTTDWLPWFTGSAGTLRSWNAPSVGTQVMVLAPSGEMAQAAVLPALYQDDFAAPSTDPNVVNFTLPDGTVISYDSGSHTLTTDLGGASLVMNKTSATITIGACAMALTASGLAVTGGKITCDQNIETPADVKAGAISLKTHKHGGVQTGGGQTGVPA